MEVNFDAPAVLPALLTPFDEAGEVDAGALREHVEFVIEGGVHGLMPCGTTGETALLEADEVTAVVTAVVEAAGGRVPVVAHVGRPGTPATARSPPTSARCSGPPATPRCSPTTSRPAPAPAPGARRRGGPGLARAARR